MSVVSAQMVKELREKTGAGMMDCKKALGESNGDMEAAVDWLRKKGLSSAAKRSARVAAEGKVVALAREGRGILVEVNSETDFSARSEKFVAFADQVAELALSKGVNSLAELMALSYPGGKGTVEEELKDRSASIGENLQVRRLETLSVASGIVSGYIHMGGKIGTLVALETSGNADALGELGKKLAMHVAAASPSFLNRQSVPSEALDRERNVLAEQAKGSGKPQQIIDKMVEGRLNKYYGEVCFVEQAYILDQETTVEKAVDAAAKEMKLTAKVTGFHRFVLGEGIEREEKNFADEVASQIK